MAIASTIFTLLILVVFMYGVFFTVRRLRSNQKAAAWQGVVTRSSRWGAGGTANRRYVTVQTTDGKRVMVTMPLDLSDGFKPGDKVAKAAGQDFPTKVS